MHACIPSTDGQLELMDATRERVVGKTEVPMFALLQQTADASFRPDRTRKGEGEAEEEAEQVLPLRYVGVGWGGVEWIGLSLTVGIDR